MEEGQEEYQDEVPLEPPPAGDPRPGRERTSLVGKLFIGLLLILIVTQGILTWKVMTMKPEKVVVTREVAPKKTDTAQYERLKKDLMALKRQKEELESVLPGLKYEVSVLIEQAENLKGVVADLEEKSGKEKAKTGSIKDALTRDLAEVVKKKQAEKKQPAAPPAAAAGASKKESARKADRAPEPGSWLLHIESFKELENARDKVASIKKKGYDALYKAVQVPKKGRFFRVYIGSFREKERAIRAGESLKKKGIIDYYRLTDKD